MEASNQNLPLRRNPLDVASLTSPLDTKSREEVGTSNSSGSSGSGSGSGSRPIGLEKNQQEPPSRSAPFACASVEETLKSHGASIPTRSPHFRFQMRQEPKYGLAVGNDDSAFKNARVTPLDPMPICEMIPEGNDDGQFLSLPEISVQARLVKSQYPFQEIPSESPATEPLINGVQETGFIAPVAARHEECLFVFAELGVRRAGQYRIRFDLIDRVGLVFKRVASIYSQTFKVVSDKKGFPGLAPSSELIHQLVRRGLKLRIIKDPSSSKRVSSTSTPFLTESYKKQRGSQDYVSDYKSSASPSEDSVRIARPPERILAGSERPQSQPMPMSQSQPIHHSQVPRLDQQEAHSTDALPWKQTPPHFLQDSARSSSYNSPRDAIPFQSSSTSSSSRRILSPFGAPSLRRDGEQAAESSRRVGWLRRDLPLPYPPDPFSRQSMSMSANTSMTPPTSSSASASFHTKRQQPAESSSNTTSDPSISTPSYPSIDRSHVPSTLSIRNKYTTSHSPPNLSSRTIEDTKASSVMDSSAPFYPSMHSLSGETRGSVEKRPGEIPGDTSRGLTLPPISTFQTRLPSMRHPEESPPDQHQRYQR